MNELEEKIKEKRSKIAKLRKAIEELRVEEYELRILERANQIVSGKLASSDNKSKSPGIIRETRRGSPPTNAEAAEEILKDHGRPMHISEIHKEIMRRYGKRTTQDAVNVTITRLVKKGEIFTRTDPSTYGLASWSKKESN